VSWRTPTGEFGRREALNWKKEIRALAALKRPCPLSCVLPIRAVKGLDSSLDNGCALEASLFGPCASIADRTECTGTFLAK
jgi:hypothetical protein